MGSLAVLMTGPRLGENRGRTQAVLPPKFFVNIGYKRVCFGVQQADLAAGPVGHVGAGGGATRATRSTVSARLCSLTRILSRDGLSPGTERGGQRYVRQMRTSMGLSPKGRQDVPHPANFVSGHSALRLRGGRGRAVSAAPVRRGRRFPRRFWCARSRRGAPAKFRCAATTSASSATSRTTSRVRGRR